MCYSYCVLFHKALQEVFKYLTPALCQYEVSRLKKIDYCTMKIEVDFVESVVYVHSDQKRESSYVGVLYIHACIYVKKVFCSL